MGQGRRAPIPLFPRNRSKKVELLSRMFDHCAHRYVKGFRMLTLGWSDGRSFLPLAFSLLGSAKEAPVPARVVFVRNRTEGARLAWLALLTTDMALTNEEVVRIYGKRRRIEVFFKSAKSLLRLAKEFQTRSYDSLTAHTSIVFLRQMMLCCEQRRTTDDRTFGDLFRLCCDELEDISFRTSLGLLLRLLKEAVASGIALSENVIDALFEKFMAEMPRLLRRKLAGNAVLSLC